MIEKMTYADKIFAFKTNFLIEETAEIDKINTDQTILLFSNIILKKIFFANNFFNTSALC